MAPSPDLTRPGWPRPLDQPQDGLQKNHGGDHRGPSRCMLCVLILFCVSCAVDQYYRYYHYRSIAAIVILAVAIVILGGFIIFHHGNEHVLVSIFPWGAYISSVALRLGPFSVWQLWQWHAPGRWTVKSVSKETVRLIELLQRCNKSVTLQKGSKGGIVWESLYPCLSPIPWSIIMLSSFSPLRCLSNPQKQSQPAAVSALRRPQNRVEA